MTKVPFIVIFIGLIHSCSVQHDRTCEQDIFQEVMKKVDALLLIEIEQPRLSGIRANIVYGSSNFASLYPESVKELMSNIDTTHINGKNLGIIDSIVPKNKISDLIQIMNLKTRPYISHNLNEIRFQDGQLINGLGVYTISKPYFIQNSDVGFVFFRFICGGYCGYDILYKIIKKNSCWHIESEVGLGTY